MLIITTPDKQPSDFDLLAQNPNTYEVCGRTEQDGYEEVQDIPSGFVQRALPPQHGAGRLTLAQIERGRMMEAGALETTIEKVDEVDRRLSVQRQGMEETLPSLIKLGAAYAGGDNNKARELPHAIAPVADMLPSREWKVGMTTEYGDIVTRDGRRYNYTGAAPMTHANPTHYPGAQGVYYWVCIPEMHDGARVWPGLTGVIQHVVRDEIWWNTAKTKKYKWNAADWNACDRYPGEPGVHQWVEVK